MSQSTHAVEPSKTINLQVTNAVALYMHALVGAQTAAELAKVGMDGLYSALANQIVQANAPAAAPAPPAPAPEGKGDGANAPAAGA